MLGKKQPTVRHPCGWAMMSLVSIILMQILLPHPSHLGLQCFFEKDGPLGIEIEPFSGLNP